MSDTPLLTVCIVTYNSETHIGNALSSLLLSTVASLMEIIVVDNASTDRTARIVEEEFPAVRLIRLSRNIGFGKGHNKALPYMNAPYHVIVNPDITLESDMLERMAAFMDTREDVAALTPRVLNPDGSEQFLPKELPSLHFLLGGYLERMGNPFAAWRSEYTWRGKDVSGQRVLQFATGCFMFVRACAFRAVNGFDPRYFLYLEDADLTRKLKTKGLTLYHPDFYVTHIWARESARAVKGTLRHVKSLLQYFLKWGLRL